jgi:tetratricopeptide (TPR) repeat protein
MSREPLISGAYDKYLDDQDSAGLIAKVSSHYTLGTLQRLTGHDNCKVRRAAVLAIGFVGDYSENHTLGKALLDDDRTTRILAENAIRSVWTRAGGEDERQQLKVIINLNTGKQHEEAIELATEMIRKAPWFAEAWHQRAVGQFKLSNFSEAIRDCHQTLEINPYHFTAAAGMGKAYLRLDNHVSALQSFRRALRLNPNLDGIRAQVVRLAKMVEDNK